MSDTLEIDSINKYFGHRPILTDIYLKCQTGDIVGILGRNGSGKSTLLQIVFGTMAADNKFIRINGLSYKAPYKTKDLMVYLPQHSYLPKHLKTDQAVALYLGKKNVDLFFEDTILNKLRKEYTSNLSGGELRYLEIKLLLQSSAKFVLLDEPFNGIAPVVTQSIKAMISAAAETKGIILTDHDYENVWSLSNRCCLMHDGHLKPIRDFQDLAQWGYISAARLEQIRLSSYQKSRV